MAEMYIGVMVSAWIDRGLRPALELATTDGLPITVLVGPRACGKTTLTRHLVDDGFYRHYVSLADPDTRSAAAASPRLFIETLPFATVLDEAQLVPDLLTPIKDIVDATGRPGQFLLTGSTRVDLPTMGGSNPLAGRHARFELGPLNATERHKRPTTNLGHLLDGTLSDMGGIDLDGPGHDAEAGETGFPLLVTTKADQRRWRRDYLRSVIPETLTASDHTVDHQRLTRFLAGIAGRSGHELVLTSLTTDLSIDRRTAARYLDLLEELRLIRRLPGLRMKATDTERAVPKLHMTDPILVTPDPGGAGDDRRGAMLETFVVNEIATQIEWIGGVNGLYHWRDRRRHEVDLVIDHDGGFIPIEIKRAREVPRTARHGIDVFRDRYRSQFRHGIILYAGQHTLPLGDDIWAIPISALWTNPGNN